MDLLIACWCCRPKPRDDKQRPRRNRGAQNRSAREDIFAAFDYYLKNVNKGERPFIIFGHPQGAGMAIELATVFLGNEEYYEHNKNHIITYALGMAVTKELIAKNPNLKFSERRDDAGVYLEFVKYALSAFNNSYMTFIFLCAEV